VSDCTCAVIAGHDLAPPAGEQHAGDANVMAEQDTWRSISYLSSYCFHQHLLIGAAPGAAQPAAGV
jgi:hypothetical protein